MDEVTFLVYESLIQQRSSEQWDSIEADRAEWNARLRQAKRDGDHETINRMRRVRLSQDVIHTKIFCHIWFFDLKEKAL